MNKLVRNNNKTTCIAHKSLEKETHQTKQLLINLKIHKQYSSCEQTGQDARELW